MPAHLMPGQGVASGRATIIEKLHQGDDASALSLAEASLRSAPRDCALLSLKAVAQAGLQQPRAALRSFQLALTYCPKYLPALEGAAQIEVASGDANAGPLLERVLAIDPANTLAQSTLANMLRSEGKCEQALTHYQASRPLFAGHPDLHQGYGACLAATGDLQGALAQYKELLLSDPNDKIRYDVALLQWRTHANDDALETLAPLLVGVKQANVLSLASKIYEEKGDTPKAVATLREAIIRAPENVDNYVDFATIAFNHKSFQVGIDMLNVGLQRLPNAAPLFVARGVLEVQLSKSDAAISDFEQATRIDPKLSYATDAIGAMQSQQHQSTAALAMFQAQVKQHPGDPLLQYLLAEQLARIADTNDVAGLNAAIAAARQATALFPAYQAAHDLLASLYVRAKQPKLAVEQAEQALALDPNDEQALYQELMARRQMENRAELTRLTERLKAVREERERKESTSIQYGLQEGTLPR